MFKTTAIFLLAFLIFTSSPKSDEYIIIGWNDLGMHCSNKDFSTLVVLPPYNNIHAQVIRVGDSTRLPEIVTSGFNVTYEIPGNTYSVGKTNFWDYEDQIFGVNLAPNIGLTGVGLSGTMDSAADYFHVEGVPITPYTDNDLVNEDPFQLGLLTLYDHLGNQLATTQPVVPVSNEINCVSSGCHTSEQSILNMHDNEGGFDPNNTPILCASCHSSNALGTTGSPGVPSLSEAIHKQHAERTDDCYKCHPGPNTQCLRDVMKMHYDFTCQTCHGDLREVGESISSGREPWLEEPSCGSNNCHGSQFAEESGLLFRQSKGHGGLYCSACHGSPHAILPSENDRDNVQNIALQNHSGTLSDCTVCHGYIPAGAGPHGLTSPDNCCDGMTGDINGDGSELPDIADLLYLVDYMFTPGSPSPPCLKEADINGDGTLTPDISDLLWLVDYMFVPSSPSPSMCQ